jgi:hypothetical protein
MTKVKNNISLYEDKHPSTSIKGLGFKNEEKAKYTLNKIKNYSLTYQKQVVITMFNRAKFHPHKNDNMKKAMKIFAKWMDKHNIKYTF